MTAISYSVEIDGRQAEPQVRKIDNSLARLKASGDNVTSSMDRLGNELGETASSLSTAEKRSLALIKAQESLTGASRAQERAIISLTDVLRSHAEKQRVVGNGLNEVKTAGEGAASTMSALSRTVAGSAAAFASFSALQVARTIVETGAAFDSLNLKFQTVFGTAERGAQQLQFIRAESSRLGLSVREAADSYALLSAASIGTNLEGQKTRDIFSAVSEASGKLSLSTEQTNGALTAIQQIISKGTVSAEELRGQLGERLPGAFQIAARAMGVTTQELGKLLEQGALASDVFLPKFTEELRRTFGTDANTRIESVTSNFARLTSEINQTVGAAGQLANVGLGPLARDAAELLKALREDPGRTGLGALLIPRNGNPLLSIVSNAQRLVTDSTRRNEARDYVAANPFKPQIDPFATTPRFSAVPEQPKQTDAGILAFGVPQANQKELLRLSERENELIARKLGLTNEQRVQQSILNGELKDRNAQEQQAELRIARLNDQLAENTKNKREGLKVENDLERLQKQAAQQDGVRANTIYQLIRGTQDQSAELQRQLQTGEQLTAAGRELLRLRSGELDFQFRGREAAKEQLAIELEGLDTLQKKVVEQDRLNDAARKAADELQDGPSTPGAAQRRARGDVISGTFTEIDANQADLRAIENGRFEKKERDLRGGSEASLRLEEGQTVDDLVEKAREEHEQRLTAIARQGAMERNQLTQAYFQSGSQIIGNLSDAAESAGLARTKRGFEAAKILSITQATISTAAAVTNALAVPPYPLGVALAASAGVAGLAQIAAIKSQKFGGGRELGGPVDSSRFFEIGEKGRPEIIQDDGKYFLFGANGNVIPASTSETRGSAQAPPFKVVINNSQSQLVDAQVSPPRMDGDGNLTMDILIQAVSDNANPFGRALSRRTGTPARGFIG